MTSDSIKPIQEQIDKINASLKNPLPTPPVGTPVVWYDRAERKEDGEIAALVTKVEGPGKVTVTVFRPQGMPDPTRRGCLHMSHPTHEQRHNAVSRNSGGWDYPIGSRAPKDHLALHTEQLNMRKDALQKSIDDIKAANEPAKSGSTKAGGTKSGSAA